ncbi:MAG: Rod shape-determining protein RodA [Candidatus Beckwithbacteria bacterium GW2011_GWB1_47_15]|uniref:Rod shape-determining protein RodA n=1 Tax=Candidatus Beckwithbacteria bacterium GW2011_GWB1_47_15 TaxID=1618371 RepID=A0A0G1U5S1_9BACT|nr:MAG: rod shape-determining protein RodA, rod shape determining protein RodA [Candidatus Beckwithbacteria bacterium GW2011_GWC1_49_16]KKU35579.1 MAG: Rod shape-determining protein RodA [Candidatus Beckwithbacteria bacterium GW2011_GWA1_46_30]KKU61633.1 MAG: Rod shape-determining protein RodA [Candidatus Beckwithbacteria bacterium GW2011_GWB1_47_15]KKU72136.1 MAG: Rod shape-determining protein RodA [Candidatus Beckwithbacteria bacterium GW2011_GWA2_47_25]KKW04761.1 MAG: Rod shape-determining p
MIVLGLMITALGLATLGSIDLNLFTSQLVFIGLGAAFFWLVYRIPLAAHRQLVWVYFVLASIFLTLPLIFGQVTRGAVRWIELVGVTAQPSEIIKPVLILVFAAAAGKKIFYYLGLMILPAFLIFNQPDLGSTLVVIAVGLAILIASNLPLKSLLLSVLAALILSPLIWFNLKPYQQTRIETFLNPFADPKGAGYQVLQSIIAVGSGGVSGRGLGRGSQSQLAFIPERHSDFIFATIAESFGLVGALVLLVLYFLFLRRLLAIAKSQEDDFSRLVAVGVFSLFAFQFTVNVGMNLGLLPVTGINLPLVSAGGSSYLASAASLALVYRISQKSRKTTLEIK